MNRRRITPVRGARVRQMIAAQSAKICIRRYDGAAECDVIVVFRGRELSLRCRDLDQAIKWARIECKAYNVAKGFTLERPKGALLERLAAAARRSSSSQTAPWLVAQS